jgi:nitric oxide reductase large subunit
VKYAWTTFVAALAIFSLFSETGPREFEGNFVWQAYLANYCLFVSAAILLCQKPLFSWGRKTAMILLFLHAVAGFAYLARLMLLCNIR